jgi:hypothetical protein
MAIIVITLPCMHCLAARANVFVTCTHVQQRHEGPENCEDDSPMMRSWLGHSWMFLMTSSSWRRLGMSMRACSASSSCGRWDSV